MLQAIAIDDEPIALQIIENFAEKVMFMELKGCFSNSFEAMAFLQKTRIDLLFLDIKMPDISGIDFIRSIPDPPMVIFTTAYSEHAVQSFELDAIDYLLKPFSLSRFLKACNKANEQLELKKNITVTSPATIYIKSGYEQIRIELERIQYVESNGNYMQFVLDDQKIMSRLTMNEVEALLPSSLFARIHRSYIISKKHITSIEKNIIRIKQKEIPIGQGYITEIEKIIR